MISFLHDGKTLPIFHLFNESDNPEEMRGRLFEKCYFTSKWIKDKDIEGSIFYNCKFDEGVEEPSGLNNIIVKNAEYLKKADNSTRVANDLFEKHYPRLKYLEYFKFGIFDSYIYFENFEASQWYFHVEIEDSILKNVKFLTDTSEELGGWGHSDVEYEVSFDRTYLNSCVFKYLDDAKKLKRSINIGVLFQYCTLENCTLAGSTDVSDEISPLNARNLSQMVLGGTQFKNCTFKNMDFRLFNTIQESTFDNCTFKNCIIEVQKMMKTGDNNFINCDIINCKNQLDIPLYVSKGKGTYSS